MSRIERLAALLDAPGEPRVGVEVPAADVRAALDELIVS